jgi:hypothetical protein
MKKAFTCGKNGMFLPRYLLNGYGADSEQPLPPAYLVRRINRGKRRLTDPEWEDPGARRKIIIRSETNTFPPGMPYTSGLGHSVLAQLVK